MKLLQNLRVKFVALNLLVLLLSFSLLSLAGYFFIQHYLFIEVKKSFLERTQVVAEDVWPGLLESEKSGYVQDWHRRFPEKKLYWLRDDHWEPSVIEFTPVREMVATLLPQALSGNAVVNSNFQGEMAALVPVQDGVLVLTLNQLHESPRNVYLIAILLVLSLVLISVLCLYPPINKIIILIRALKTLASRVAQGHFGEKIAENRSDEMGELTQSFNLMSQQLAEAEKQNHNLIAGVSHELKSPLTRIRVNAEQLTLSSPNPTDIVTRSQTICEDVDHLDSIVNDLLSSTRMRIEPVSLKTEALDICLFLKKIVRLYDKMEKLNGVHIQYHSTVSRLIMNIDKRLIKQALTNLIDNALTAVKKNGTIVVGLRDEDNHCIIEVTDDGPGIEKQYQKLIFDRFYRIDPSRHRGTGGVGLGLTIVKQIIEAHNGEIELKSDPGKGSVFRISIPL